MKTTRLIILYFLLTACVDSINFDTPTAEFQLVLDGYITDDAGPHVFTLSRASSLNADLDRKIPVFSAKITLVTNGTSEELLTEVERGVYHTKTSTRGVIGNSYQLRIQTSDGKNYESTVEKILPSGTIENIRYEFSSATKLVNGVETADDRFQIFVDARGATGTQNNLRWKLNGTYAVETFPYLRTRTNEAGLRVPDPFPCSGYEVRALGLTKVAECACCYCWISESEDKPTVSDDQFVQGNLFQNVNVVSIPVNRRTFYDKYYVEIQQMNLSPGAFSYYKLIRAQKEGAASLFQPPAAKLRSNISNVNDPDEEVQGYFMAVSLARKAVFIKRTDVPVRLLPIDTLRTSCLFLDRSTATKPSYWQ